MSGKNNGEDYLLETLIPLSLVSIAVAIYTMQHFASPGTSNATKFLATIAFWLGFNGVVLLPIDLSFTVKLLLNERNDDDDDESAYVPPDVNSTYLPWQLTYWISLFLAFAILPVIRLTLLSGYFTVSSRFRNAVRFSLIRYILGGFVGIVCVLGLAIHYKSFYAVIPVIMALGNTYGLLLVSVLMGYGLVDVPRQMWRNSNPELELRRCRIMAVQADEALFDAVWELQDVEAAIDATLGDNGAQVLESIVDDDLEYQRGCCGITRGCTYRQCVEELAKCRNDTAYLGRVLQTRRTKRRASEPTDTHVDNSYNDSSGLPSVATLADLKKRLQLAQAKIVSAEQRFHSITERAALCSSMLLSSDDSTEHAPPPCIRVPPNANLLAVLRAKLDSTRAFSWYLWSTKLYRPVSKLLSVTFASLSIMVLWSEASMPLNHVNLSPFALFLSWLDNNSITKANGFFFMITALIPLLYMSACVYSSLFKLSFFGPYCLRGYKQSPGVALLFNAQYLIRMQFPLGYNYLLMLKYDTESTNCAFAQVMSDMSTVPFFGTNFSVYAPLLILALTCFTLLNGYARFLSLLGIEHEDAILLGDTETLDRQVKEGISLIERRKRDAAQSPEGGGGGKGFDAAATRSSYRSQTKRSSSRKKGSSSVGCEIENDAVDNETLGGDGFLSSTRSSMGQWLYGVV